MSVEKLIISLDFENVKIQVGELVQHEKNYFFKFNSNFLDLNLDVSPFKMKRSSGLLQADSQPFDERSADALTGDFVLHAAAGPRAALLWWRDARRLRAGVGRRCRLRYLLIDLHCHSGADALEGRRRRLALAPRTDCSR